MSYTYAISDIHGCFDQLQNLLDKISPTDDDNIYILGDLCDRGPKSADVLTWAINDAPSNFHFLLGNHDKMILDTAHYDAEYLSLSFNDLWSINGGYATTKQILEKTDPDWRKTVMLPWLRALKPWQHITVDNTEMMLVHAGFNPNMWDTDNRTFVDVFPDDNVYEIGHGFKTQDTQTMTWVRRGWFDYTGECPLTTIYGHTPTVYLKHIVDEIEVFGRIGERRETSRWFENKPAAGRIWKNNNHIDIDCGCAVGQTLGALRLNDFEEFYVDGYNNKE